MWHWLKGHKWTVIGMHCDEQFHYFPSNPSGHYFATNVMYQCTECGIRKTTTVRGGFKQEKKDALTEALQYLEKDAR